MISTNQSHKLGNLSGLQGFQPFNKLNTALCVRCGQVDARITTFLYFSENIPALPVWRVSVLAMTLQKVVCCKACASARPSQLFPFGKRDHVLRHCSRMAVGADFGGGPLHGPNSGALQV